MKKRVLFSIFFILLISMSFAFAQEDLTNATDSLETIDPSAGAIDDAYDCLKDAVVGKCSSLPLETKIFALLALGECDTEVLAESPSGLGEYWSSSGSANVVQIFETNDSAAITINSINWIDSMTVEIIPVVEWEEGLEAISRHLSED